MSKTAERSYQDLSQLLSAAYVDSSVSEVHGILCGLLCGKAVDVFPAWVEAVFTDHDPQDVTVAECRDAMDALMKETSMQLEQAGLELALLLPADDAQPDSRAIAIRDWSQGFLYGFGLTGRQPESLLSQDAGEALRDFTEISRIDVEEMGEEYEAEEALTQLEEYLWVAALLIYHDVLSSKRAH